MSNLSLLGETSTSMSDLSNGRGPATLCKPSSKSALPVDALHFAVWYGRTTEVKKLIIEGGLNIEVLNNHGQTPLFVAAYIQNYFSVKTLLQLGANPNGRSVAGYTPTHAACYSGSKKILNKILEAGGDLRLHDENHCTPIDWALWQSDGEKRLRIMELIETARRCTMKQSGKEALVEKNFSRNFGGRASLTTLFKKKLPVKGGKNGKQEVDMGELVKNIHAMGFGKIYFGNGLKAAAISTIPYIDASDLSPDRHYPTYSSGSFTEMSSKLWLHTRVTVRSLLEPPPSGALVDILISELEALCKLTHPQILLLMGVCQTKNYEGLMLVFEHVQLGSLYYCLHEKDCMPKIKNAVDIILQIVDALIYLHSHGWLHCSLTSHAVHLVGPNVAKLSSFELAVEDKEETRRNRTFDLLSDKGWQSIYNWLCPDILRGEPPSKCGDLYSLCCLIWEISTGQVPWGNLDPDEILVEIKLKGHSLPLDKKYIPKHLMMVLEQGLKLRGDERDVDLHEIRDMLILTRKDAVKNEKKFNSNQSHQNTSSSVHRDSSTTDSGVWLGSGNQPMRSYSSSAIQRSPQSSHSSHSYNYCHHSAEEDDGNSQKNIDEFTGLRKTSSILKRKKYEKTFGSFPAKGFSSSHQDVDSNYDYVKNRAKRHFLRNGSVSKNDYIRKTANKSDEDLRRRSLSSLYHATLVASDKYNGIDLLSSSEHSSSTSDLSPYYSGDSLSGDITSQPEKRRSVSPEIGILRSRSVPRTNSSTIPVSNSAAEFVAAHLQEANKRGYGRTFSNLSQKSRENLDENTDDHFRESKLGLSSFKSSNKFSNRSNDIKPASHAIQRNSPSPIKNVPSSSNQLPTKNNKKDLVSSMSKLNLHIPVPASKPQVSSLASSIIHKNKSSSAIRSPLGAFKEAYQSCAEKSTDLVTRKTKSLASLPKLTASKFDANTYELKPDDIDAIRIIEESGKSEAQSKLNEQKRTLGKADRNADQIGSSSGKSFVKRYTSINQIREKYKQKSEALSKSNTKEKDSQHKVLIHSSNYSKTKSAINLKEAITSKKDNERLGELINSGYPKKSKSVGSLRSVWNSKTIGNDDDNIQPKSAVSNNKSYRKGNGSAIARLTGKSHFKSYSQGIIHSKKESEVPKSESIIHSKKESKVPKSESFEDRPYTMESKILSSRNIAQKDIANYRSHDLNKIPNSFSTKGPNPNSIIYSNTRCSDRQSRFKGVYSSICDRKPSGDIVRSADRVSSPPRSQWSTKGVQNLIQNLESIQQQKLEEQQQVQNNTLYQTAPSEFLISSNNRSSNHNLPKPEGKESILEYNNSTNNFEASNNNNDAIEDNNLICFDAPAKSDNPDTVWNNNDIYGSNQVANSDWTKNSNSMNNNQNNIYTTQCDNFGSGNNEIPDCYNNFSGNVDTQTTPYNDNSPSKQDINNDSYSQPNYQDNYVNLNSENDLQYNYKNHGDDIQQQQINNDLNTIDAHTPMNDQYNNQDVHGSLVIGSNNPQEEQFDNVNSGNSQDLHWDIDGNDQSNNNVDGSSMNVWTTVKENNSVGLCSNDLENNCNVPYNNNSICPYNAENPSANTFQDVNLTQQEIDNHTNEYNNNNQFLNEKSSDANRVPSSQNILSVHQLNCSIDPCSCTPRQSPILKSAGLSPSHPFALRTSTPNEYNSHKLHKTMQDAYTSALAEAIEEEEITRDVENSSLNNSECWNTADSDMILFQQQHSGVRSSAMVRHMEKKLKKKSSQKQILKDVESKRETNNVTFNSEVLEISNSVSTQTLDADMSSRRTSAASSFVSQPDTEDLYCDDELNPSLENDPNMQLTISRALESEDTTDFPQTPIFNDFDSILSMDTPSTGPTSLRSEYSEDKDTYNTASSSSDEEDNSVSGDIEVEIASENTRDDENVNYQNGSSIEDSEEHFTTTSSQ
ncbi:uncharacterized protein [Lepeophtheirus salmonis]|uniref:uncharacterized protein isoform X1 n=1 Tax=Lepeophtheirus salmonis TaxID=72036 RepID=UPI001AE474B0|nr:putative uncharacterized protein DDB_G0282133 isoform X2 [Lepeophtheirus salmonis]